MTAPKGLPEWVNKHPLYAKDEVFREAISIAWEAMEYIVEIRHKQRGAISTYTIEDAMTRIRGLK